MAVPKRKMSKARRDSRRANWKLSVPNMVECPQCHELMLPHHVCPECGYYDGKQVVKTDEEQEHATLLAEDCKDDGQHLVDVQ